MKNHDNRVARAVNSPSRKMNWGLLLSLLVIGVMFAGPAIAGGADPGGGTGTGGTGGAEFNPIVDWLVGSLQGGLGKLLAIAAFAVGMGIGVVKQSVMAAVVGISFAIVLFFGPTVIINMFGAAV